jgi:putative ABC transport system substrate-binding protein
MQFDELKCRDFITLLGGAAATWPLAARAQQPAMPVIGFVGSRSLEDSVALVAAFRKGLGETGFSEGRNVTIEFHWAEGHYDRLPALAADLVRRQVTVIVTVGDPSVLAAKAATASIPIVFVAGVDPLRYGLVASINRPGGNVTGVSVLSEVLEPKRLELLRELVPTAAAVAMLVNPRNRRTEFDTKNVQAAAGSMGLQFIVLNASTESEIAAAFANLVQQGAGALIVGADPFLISQSEQLAALAAHHAIPAVHAYREFAAAGGLMSYGPSLADAYRQAGIYTGKILMGAKPADLPVEQSTRVELVINLKTAKALGLTLPLPLLGRADEVIE